MKMTWTGVLPALTTNLRANGAIDHPALLRHCRWMLDSGCTGLVCCGSLGEAATLSFAEKISVVTTAVKAAAGRAPVVLGIASLSTAEAVALAKDQPEACGLLLQPQAPVPAVGHGAPNALFVKNTRIGHVFAKSQNFEGNICARGLGVCRC